MSRSKWSSHETRAEILSLLMSPLAPMYLSSFIFLLLSLNPRIVSVMKLCFPALVLYSLFILVLFLLLSAIPHVTPSLPSPKSASNIPVIQSTLRTRKIEAIQGHWDGGSMRVRSKQSTRDERVKGCEKSSASDKNSFDIYCSCVSFSLPSRHNTWRLPAEFPRNKRSKEVF